MSDYTIGEYIISFICNISREIKNNFQVLDLSINNETLFNFSKFHDSLCSF